MPHPLGMGQTRKCNNRTRNTNSRSNKPHTRKTPNKIQHQTQKHFHFYQSSWSQGKPPRHYHHRIPVQTYLLKTMENMILSSRLTPSETLRAYKTVFLPSIIYPMGAVYFSPLQCQQLQNTAAQAYLPKLGFNRKI